MAQDSTQIQVAPHGHLYTAPLGSTQPTDVTTAWAAAWKELGYVDENGVKITPNLSTTDLKAWQSLAPVKRVATDLQFDLDFNMMQMNSDTTSLYFFGTVWGAPSGGVSALVISSQTSLPEVMLGVEWDNGSGTVQRLIVPRGTVTKQAASNLVRKDAWVLGVTFSALDSSGTFFTLLSNSAAV